MGETVSPALSALPGLPAASSVPVRGECREESPGSSCGSSSAWRVPSLLLFFLILFLPTQHQGPKGVVLALVLTLVGAGALRGGRFALHRSVALWGLVLIGTGLVFMLRGIATGGPGAVRVGTVYALWPVAFLLWLSAGDARSLRAHVALIAPTALLIAVYGLDSLLHEAGLSGRLFLPELGQERAVGLNAGFVELGFPALATMVFAVPFLIASVFLAGGERGDEPPLVRRRWLWLALLLGIPLVTLSGRRALLLVTGAAPFVTLALLAFLPAADRRALGRRTLVFAGALALLLVGFFALAPDWIDLSPGAVWAMFAEGFDPTSSDSSSVRAFQVRELLAGWREAPLFGAGLGSFVPDHIRDPNRPWAYELSYVALLFQTGVVGFLAYAGLLGWIYARGIAILRAGGAAARTMLPVLVGTTCFLIANGTNPYLGKFDFLWVVFLPVALINAALLGEEEPA